MAGKYLGLFNRVGDRQFVERLELFSEKTMVRGLAEWVGSSEFEAVYKRNRIVYSEDLHEYPQLKWLATHEQQPVVYLYVWIKSLLDKNGFVKTQAEWLELLVKGDGYSLGYLQEGGVADWLEAVVEVVLLGLVAMNVPESKREIVMSELIEHGKPWQKKLVSQVGDGSGVKQNEEKLDLLIRSLAPGMEYYGLLERVEVENVRRRGELHAHASLEYVKTGLSGSLWPEVVTNRLLNEWWLKIEHKPAVRKWVGECLDGVAEFMLAREEAVLELMERGVWRNPRGWRVTMGKWFGR